MAARDSDDDIRKYMPDLKAILRTADPKVAAATRRTALDAPEVAEVIAELREDNEVTQPVGVGPAAPGGPRASGEMDRTALPYATAPTAAPPVVREAANGAPKTKKKAGFPLWASGGAAVLAVVGPVALTVVLLGRQGPPVGPTAPSAEATGRISSGSSGAAPVALSTAPSSAQAPTLPSTLPASAPPPPPSSVPAVRPKLGGEPSPPKPSTSADAGAPPPVPAPPSSAPPINAPPPSAPPAPGKSPVEGDRVFGN